MANRTIGTELKLTGEKEFNQQMKAINSTMKTTKSDMAALSSEFDDNANSVKALTAKQKLLQTGVDQHKAKVAALTNQYEAAAAAYGENSAMAQKYKQQLNQATVALNKATAALDENKSQLRAARNPIKSAVDGYKSLVERLAEAQEKTEQFAEKQKKANELLAKAAKPVTGLVSVTGKAAQGIGAITAAAAAGVAAIGAGGVVALTAMVNMANEAAEAARTAQEAGETLTATQEQWLAYAGKLDTLQGAATNAKSALAGILLPALNDVSTEGAALLNGFTKAMEAAGTDTDKQAKVMSDYIVKGAMFLKTNISQYAEVGETLLTGILEGLGENAGILETMGIDLVMDLLDTIIDHAPDLAQAGIQLIQRLTQSLADRGPDVMASAVQMVSEITMGLAQAAPSLIPAAVQLVVQLTTALVSNAPLLLEAGLELIYGIISGLIAGIGELASSSDSLIEALVDGFEKNGPKIMNVGSRIVNLIKDGIASAWSSFSNWVNSKWESLLGNLKVNVGFGEGDSPETPPPSSASGLSYVPYDGYLSRLHKGEMVLTAEQASAYRGGQTGQTVKQFNLTIQTQSLSKEELDSIVDYMNRKLGDDL